MLHSRPACGATLALALGIGRLGMVSEAFDRRLTVNRIEPSGKDQREMPDGVAADEFYGNPVPDACRIESDGCSLILAHDR